jgi:hypothetical protein
MVTVVVAAMMRFNSLNVQFFPCPFPLFEEFVAIGDRRFRLFYRNISNFHLNFRAKKESRGTERNPMNTNRDPFALFYLQEIVLRAIRQT